MTPEQIEIEKAANRRAAMWAFILAPVIVPLYSAALFYVWSLAAVAWHGLRATIGF